MKIYIFLICLFTYSALLSQNVIPRSSDAITVMDGRLYAKLNLRLPLYSDTTSANASIGADSCGALIFTYTNNNIWKRSCNPKRWQLVSPNAVSSGNPDSLGNRPSRYYSVAIPITITWGATSSWDMSIGNIGYITLAGNTTLAISNPTANTYYEFEVTQDATGSRTITWPTTFKWSSGTAPTLTTTANAKDVITCSYNGTIFKCNFTPDYR